MSKAAKKPKEVEEKVEIMGKYHFGEILGRGGFGIVFKALNTENGMTVAVKRVNKDDLDDEKLASIEV